MKVTATKPGFFGKLREVGEEFEVPEGVNGSWFAAEKKPAKGKAKTSDAADQAGEAVEA